MFKKLSILSVLVLAVAVSAYSVAGTYAKYTTSETGSDSARVAKWGVGLTNTAEIFASSYTNGTAIDVKSGDNAKVVAPGTAGSYTFELTGTPEVNYTLKVTGSVVFTNDIEDSLKANLKFYIDDDTTAIGADDLITSINALYADNVYAAGVTAAQTHTIKWEWEFNGDDAKDTALGNAAALGTAIPEVRLEVTITATQTEATATVTA